MKKLSCFPPWLEAVLVVALFIAGWVAPGTMTAAEPEDDSSPRRIVHAQWLYLGRLDDWHPHSSARLRRSRGPLG